MKTHIFFLILVPCTLIMGNKSFCHDNNLASEGPYTIIYSAMNHDGFGIYIGDTKSEPKIKNIETKDGGYFAWSPNGKKIAFYAKYDERKTWSIHTMNSDGTNVKRLTHEQYKWDSAPAWSPDGKKIAFARSYKDLEGMPQAEIWIMGSDGSEPTQIKALKGSAPYFTPDGRIVFCSESKGKKSELSIADMDGNHIVQLTDNDANEWHPDVSPDGKHITFMSDRDGNLEIYVMDIDGSNQKRLTHSDIDDWYPAWAPDGSKILFSSYKNYQKDRHIYIMNKDGSSQKKIISNSGYAIFKR